MSTPLPPADPPTSTLRSRWRRIRPRGRGAVIGSAVLALLVVGGVAVALVIPDGGPGRDGGGRGGPEVGLSSGLADAGGLGAVDGLGAREEGGGRGGRDGLGRLGDDTLLAGTVTSVGDGTLVVTPDGDTPRTIRTDDRTRVRGTGNTALGDLQAGERVVVRVTGAGDAATAVGILVPTARVTGTVTALAGDTATVTTIDGLVMTVDIAGVGQKPVVGNLVVLSGTAANGALKADSVRVLPVTG